MSDALQELLDKQAITEVIYRYSRGLDRMDKEMAYRVWHEDGTADYDAIFEGTGHGFVDWVWEAHEPMDAHSHQMTNILIEVDGDGATSETYAIVTLRTKRAPDGSASLITSRGRYLDRWSRRGGVWAIDHRVHVQDVSSTETIPADRVEDSTPRATRDEKDASRGLFSRRNA
ncbi:MAG: nuclear transport factor 2 family protein [Myxococcales bacterium]|nr:nuclear transport factor 2 family protein [Myxococcales bacterium]